ncbi:head maturation protease, ClpP-related [Sulfitobacter dubius]|uniref:head maturation protease, ClpP-related n=1 Tax=Sulfitobacter dubius TaxID=218673 RepID=UPI0022AF89DB|nr:head maturation protease, ClpP-related [Sulfitobacter dubius]MCZ4366625.1 Clp protease ClpP [Sulfitobacter dubius]
MSLHDAVALYRTKAPRKARAAGYEVVRQEGEASAKIKLFGPIDAWEDSALNFVEELEQLQADGVKEADVQINSLGGDVWESMTIADAIRSARANGMTFRAVVLGVAASGATIIASSCDATVIGKNARYMIHEAASGCWGSADDMREVAAMLDDINTQAVEIYVEQSGQTPDQIKTWMAETRWFRGQEAVDAGFAASILDMDAEACADEEDLRTLDNAPSDLLEEIAASGDTEDEVKASDPDQETVEDAPAVETPPELVSVELSVNGSTISMSVSAETAAALKDAGELVTKPTEIEPEMKAPEDPLVASLKSGSQEPVMTARPDSEAASQRKAPASWTKSIAAMNANFGKI